MHPDSPLAFFVAWPVLALLPAAFFGWLYRRSHQRLVLAAAAAWCVYFAYEQWQSMGVRCSGDCEWRVDLIVLYPLLGLLSIAAVIAHGRSRAIAG